MHKKNIGVMLHYRSWTILAALLALFFSSCNHGSARASAAQGSEQAYPTADFQKSWDPKWTTFPLKVENQKSILAATIAFADDGFAGSPVPQNAGERKQEAKARQDFAESFQSEPECFGITLMQKNPKDADFRLQIFNGLDGRTGSWQWVLYRMDTSGENAHGETTGMGQLAKSACESIRPLITPRGGNVD